MILTDYIPDRLWNQQPFTMSTVPASGFFPIGADLAPIRSGIAAPAPSFGAARVTSYESPSIAQTAQWASNNWMASPYAPELSIVPATPAPIYGPPAPTSSPSFLSGLTKPWELMAESVGSAVETTFVEANKMLPGLMMEKLGLWPEAQVVNTQGATEYHIYGQPSKAPATIPGLKQEQPVGLFGIGYGSANPAPVQNIPTATAAGGLVISPILLLLGFFILSRK